MFGRIFFYVFIFLMFWIGRRWRDEPAVTPAVICIRRATRWPAVAVRMQLRSGSRPCSHW